MTDSSSAGFPHSDINGSKPACGSPLLFAACHVLHRRMVPGHPPCALCSLIFSSLILRPIVFSLPTAAFRLPFATGLFESSRFCCAVVKVRVDRALKTIQTRDASGNQQRFLTLSRNFVDLLVENSTRDLCRFYPDPSGSDRPGIGFRISASAFSLERR